MLNMTKNADVKDSKFRIEKEHLRTVAEHEDEYFYALCSLRSSSPADVTFSQTVTQFAGERWKSRLSPADRWHQVMRVNVEGTIISFDTEITSTVPARSVLFFREKHLLMATPALTWNYLPYHCMRYFDVPGEFVRKSARISVARQAGFWSCPPPPPPHRMLSWTSAAVRLSNRVKMGARQQCSCGLRLPVSMWIFLLFVFVATCADRENNETRSSPDVVPGLDPHRHSNATSLKKAFPVLSVNYDYVRKPFEISLWILLALLMKLGEWRLFMQPQRDECTRSTISVDKKSHIIFVCLSDRQLDLLLYNVPFGGWNNTHFPLNPLSIHFFHISVEIPINGT